MYRLKHLKYWHTRSKTIEDAHANDGKTNFKIKILKQNNFAVNRKYLPEAGTDQEPNRVHYDDDMKMITVKKLWLSVIETENSIEAADRNLRNVGTIWETIL